MDFSILRFSSVTSTNDEADASDWPDGTVIVADTQTAGRGQRGNKWESKPGENLMFSLVLRPEEFPVEDNFHISKAASLSVVDALAELGIEAKVKWPNDIYVGDLKICGILIENRLAGAFISKSVVGVGINVNQTEFDPSLPNPVSVAQCLGRSAEAGYLLNLFCESFAERISQEPAHLDADYFDKLYRGSGFHPFMRNGQSFNARIEGIMPSGELLLTDENGKTLSFAFKEVEFIICKS